MNQTDLIIEALEWLLRAAPRVDPLLQEALAMGA